MTDPATNLSPGPFPFEDILAAAQREAQARGESPNKIDMIKVLRQRTGLKLKAAKDVVEDYGRRQAIEWATTWTGVSILVLAVVAAIAVVAGLVAVFRW